MEVTICDLKIVTSLFVRIYMKMREMALSYKELIAKIDEMEKKYDKQFQVVFKAIKLLLEKPKAGPARRFE